MGRWDFQCPLQQIPHCGELDVASKQFICEILISGLIVLKVGPLGSNLVMRWRPSLMGLAH